MWYTHPLPLFRCGTNTSCHCFSVVSACLVTISVWYPHLLLLFQRASRSIATVSVWYPYLLLLFQCGTHIFCYCFSVHPIHSHCFSVLPIHCHCFSMLFRSFVTVSVWHLDLLSLSQCGISIFVIASVYFDPCHCFSVVSRSFVTVSVWYLDPCHYFSMISRSLPLFQYGISILCHCLSVVSRSFVIVSA